MAVSEVAKETRGIITRFYCTYESVDPPLTVINNICRENENIEDTKEG